MEIIVGSVVLKDNKLLMIKEAKEKCCGKWSFPAGHLEKNETIFDGARRETTEETGCEIDFKKIFPIFTQNTEHSSVIIVYFLADLLKENKSYYTDEILETKWMTIDEIKNMKKEEFRSYPVMKQLIISIENENLYQLDMIKNMANI